jgi:hypothetical protein
MGWRWRESLNLGGGARATMTAHGVGVSWGLAGFRIGRSPTGSLWVSFTVPGTGISFFRYLSPESFSPTPQQQPSVPAPPPALPHGPNPPLTANQRILEEIRRTTP